MTAPQHPPARLTIRRGAARTSISTSSAIDGLADLSFAGRRPAIDVGDDAVLISYPIIGLPGLQARSATVVLNERRSWTIEVNGGAGYLYGRLEDTSLHSITIRGGAARTSLRLPQPAGVVPITIGGGVSHVDLRVPQGAGYRLDISGGVSNLVLDDQFLGSVGGPYHARTPGLLDNDDHYSIAVGGGASRLSVTSSVAQQRVTRAT